MNARSNQGQFGSYRKTSTKPFASDELSRTKNDPYACLKANEIIITSKFGRVLSSQKLALKMKSYFVVNSITFEQGLQPSRATEHRGSTCNGGDKRCIETRIAYGMSSSEAER